jgi:hypothetical protein
VVREFHLHPIAGAAYGTRPITIATTTTGAGVTTPRVVVAGGHSAGHIEPTMNFADALRRLEPTAEITALGTVRGLDTTEKAPGAATLSRCHFL